MPTLPSRPPKSVTIGTGADTIVMRLSQDWYLANASYNVTVDGVQVGANQTVSSIRSTGNYDTVTVRGDWAAGPHTVAINFLNDAFDGTNYTSPDFHDRNMYVRSVTVDGVALGSSADLDILSPSYPHSFTFDTNLLIPQNPPKSVVLGTGPDSLVMRVSQSWYLANAQYNVFVDGVQVGANQTVSSIDPSGNLDTVTVHGNWLNGTHTVDVNFLNDAADTSQPYVHPNFHDRNIFVQNVTLNGVPVPNSDLDILSPNFNHTFTFSKSASSGIPNNPATSTTVGTGANSIVMHVSQDYYAPSNAQYTVAVDGVQIGGTITASAIKAQGLFDTVTVKGTFPAGSHALTVTLLNDDWDGTWGPDGNTPNGHDRNVYVRSVTLNGTAVAGSDLDVLDSTPQSFTFQGASSGGGGGTPNYPAALTGLGITNARMTFHDEFDTLSVSNEGPPTTTWSSWGHGLGDTMDVVNQYNLLSVSNSVVQMSYAEGGHRAILASSNGENGNGFHQKYGYFEARMKLPTSDNIWGAFWLAADESTWSTSPDNYEIDVLEYFTQHVNGLRNQYITSEVHDWYALPQGGQLVPSPLWYAEGYDSSSGGDMAADFHTYGMYWDPNLFIFFIDGVEKTRGVPPTQNVPPVYIIFDLEVNTGGSHPEQPVTYPASMYVDWVRVWQLPQF